MIWIKKLIRRRNWIKRRKGKDKRKRKDNRNRMIWLCINKNSKGRRMRSKSKSSLSSSINMILKWARMIKSILCKWKTAKLLSIRWRPNCWKETRLIRSISRYIIILNRTTIIMRKASTTALALMTHLS